MGGVQGGARLIIVCGLPGSGKTTHAKQLEGRLRALRLCADEWMAALQVSLWDETMRTRMEALQWEVAKRMLTLGQTVIIEWGTWAKSERDALREGAREFGASVELHFLDAPVDVLFQRIRARNMEQPPIEREDVVKWSEMFQRPTAEEMILFDPPTTEPS
jgi:predicted kinase